MRSVMNLKVYTSYPFHRVWMLFLKISTILEKNYVRELYPLRKGQPLYFFISPICSSNFFERGQPLYEGWMHGSHPKVFFHCSCILTAIVIFCSVFLNHFIRCTRNEWIVHYDQEVCSYIASLKLVIMCLILPLPPEYTSTNKFIWLWHIDVKAWEHVMGFIFMHSLQSCSNK